MARNFARQPIKESSLALLERANNLRVGTVQTMQVAKQRLEQREVDGKRKSTLATTLQGKREAGRAKGPQPMLEAIAAERRDLMQRLKDIGPQVREAMRIAIERVRTRVEREAEKFSNVRRRGRGM